MGFDDYYQMVEGWNEKFWSRLGGKPVLTGKKCLDLGCGVGALSINLVTSGAKEVVGIDPDPERIEYATHKKDQLSDEFLQRLSFRSIYLDELVGEETFDIVVSRDSFEHIHDLSAVVSKLVSILNPGGKLYLGFGPLYNSPLGDHRLMGFGIPWLHLFMDKFNIGKLLFPKRFEHVNRELNRLSYREMKNILYASGLTVTSFEVNSGTSLPLAMFRVLRRMPWLREFCSVNIYAILTKSENSILDASVYSNSPESQLEGCA